MKRKPFWLRKWAGWSLALACSFSNSPVLLGQSGQPKLTRPAGLHQGGQPVLAKSSVMIMPMNQMQEDRLHLAWLNDAATFRLNLKIQAADGGIRVMGCVPNDSVRKRVIAIASKISGGMVHDGLQSVPGMLPGFSENLSPQEMHQRAQEIINAAVPNCASQVVIQTDPLGRIVLTGQVHTLKDMLHICRGLRQIPQCTSLVNRLSLGAFTQAPQVAANIPVSPPLLPRQVPVIPEVKAPLNKVGSAPVMQNNEPVPQHVAKTSWATNNTWKPMPASNSTQEPNLSHGGTPSLPQHSKLPNGNKVISYDLGPPYEAIALVSISTKNSPETANSDTPVLKMKNWSDFQPVSYQKNSTIPEPKVQSVPPLPTGPVEPVKTQPITPMKLAPIPKAQSVVPPHTNLPTPKMPTVPTQSIPTTPAMPKNTITQPVVKNRPSPAQVKSLVEKYCGNKARKVMVRYMEDGKIEIRLQVQQEAHATAVFEEIVRIGELAPYQIKLKVEVAR